MKSWGRAVPSSDSNWHVSWGWANINNWIPDFGLTGEDIQLLSNLLFWFRHILLRLSSIDVVFLSKLPKIVLGFARVEIQSSSSIFPKNSIIFSLTSVDQQMIVSKFWSFPAISLLARVAVAQDMWWWLRRICGGGSAGYVVGEIKNKANSAQLELELGLSLAKF